LRGLTSDKQVVSQLQRTFYADFSSGDTGLQIVYPATQAQPRRVRLLIEKIAQAFSSSGL